MEQLSQNKELTPLEALKDIERVCKDSDYQFAYYKERLDIIETALKALEIIVKKVVCLTLLNFCFTLNEYNFEVSKNRKLTQEEFNLLKKVLK